MLTFHRCFNLGAFMIGCSFVNCLLFSFVGFFFRLLIHYVCLATKPIQCIISPNPQNNISLTLQVKKLSLQECEVSGNTVRPSASSPTYAFI